MDSGFRALSAYGCRLSSALRLTSALSPQIQARDSATALQAAVVQPHRALDRLRTYAALAAGLEPAAPSTTGDYPLSQHQYYEAITTTDSERQADRARRQTSRLANYAAPSETHAQPQIRYCLTVVTSRTLPHKSIFCLSVRLSVCLTFSRPLQRKKSWVLVHSLTLST